MQEPFQRQKRLSKGYETAFPDRHFMSRNVEAWKFKRAVLQNEETYQAKYLQNLEFLESLSSDKAKKSKGLVISYFEIR